MPEVEITYTRTRDVYVAVAERGEIANRAGADLFISIHINSTDKGSSPNGTSTYVMGYDHSNKNLEVIMRENAVITYEGDYTTRYQGYRPGSPESYIMFSLKQFANQEQSMVLAETIQKHYTKDLPMSDRGAHHGPFLVLWNTAMPRVLTEIGFITNTKDRQYITSERGQNAIAKALYNAIAEYKNKVEGRIGMVRRDAEPSSQPVSQAVSQTVSQPTAQADGYREAPVEPVRTIVPEMRGEYTQPRTRTTLPDIAAHFREADERSAKLEAEKREAEKRETEAREAARLEAERSAGEAAGGSAGGSSVTPAVVPTAVAIPDVMIPAPVADGRIRYYVQLGAFAKRQSAENPAFRSYRGKVVESINANGVYRYMTGGVESWGEAERLLRRVRTEFMDAFAVAFEGDRQIPVDEARKRTR
jgi:cell division protein FtsN